MPGSYGGRQRRDNRRSSRNRRNNNDPADRGSNSSGKYIKTTSQYEKEYEGKKSFVGLSKEEYMHETMRGDIESGYYDVYEDRKGKYPEQITKDNINLSYPPPSSKAKQDSLRKKQEEERERKKQEKAKEKEYPNHEPPKSPPAPIKMDPMSVEDILKEDKAKSQQKKPTPSSKVSNHENPKPGGKLSKGGKGRPGMSVDSGGGVHGPSYPAGYSTLHATNDAGITNIGVEDPDKDRPNFQTGGYNTIGDAVIHGLGMKTGEDVYKDKVKADTLKKRGNFRYASGPPMQSKLPKGDDTNRVHRAHVKGEEEYYNDDDDIYGNPNTNTTMGEMLTVSNTNDPHKVDHSLSLAKPEETVQATTIPPSTNTIIPSNVNENSNVQSFDISGSYQTPKHIADGNIDAKGNIVTRQVQHSLHPSINFKRYYRSAITSAESHYYTPYNITTVQHTLKGPIIQCGNVKYLR